VRREAASGDELAWHPAAGELPLESCRTVDAVINLCGADIAAKRWTHKRRNEIRSSRIDTTQTLAKIFGDAQHPSRGVRERLGHRHLRATRGKPGAQRVERPGKRIPWPTCAATGRARR
jgi:hypothetical protein